jgi:hypothetical protein
MNDKPPHEEECLPLSRSNDPYLDAIYERMVFEQV